METHHDSAGCSCQAGWGVNSASELYPLAIDLPRQFHMIALQAVVLQSMPTTRGEGSFIIYLVTYCVKSPRLFFSRFGYSSELPINQWTRKSLPMSQINRDGYGRRN
jgi:hypothetical protein